MRRSGNFGNERDLTTVETFSTWNPGVSCRALHLDTSNKHPLLVLETPEEESQTCTLKDTTTDIIPSGFISSHPIPVIVTSFLRLMYWSQVVHREYPWYVPGAEEQHTYTVI